MQTAKVLKLPAPEPECAELPEVLENITGDARAIAIAKFRELANKLESGELAGARVEWRDNYGAESQMVTVELDRSAGKVQLRTFTIEEG